MAHAFVLLTLRGVQGAMSADIGVYSSQEPRFPVPSVSHTLHTAKGESFPEAAAAAEAWIASDLSASLTLMVIEGRTVREAAIAVREAAG